MREDSDKEKDVLFSAPFETSSSKDESFGAEEEWEHDFSIEIRASEATPQLMNFLSLDSNIISNKEILDLHSRIIRLIHFESSPDIQLANRNLVKYFENNFTKLKSTFH